ncbi:hypothetical protein [Chitinimonas koreensis]|uniref:hypothetical protein n=1 Tax=Chitinimonas koreensis TaxID=356302 RepID=UPI0016540BD0|nr:hypothetical protein [Chitinimonas koreensis]QNM96183.1 hypothetical protein H9L41_20620 [Chitinimonas koreensis]
MSRPWQILLLAPAGYPHIGAFREVAETLHHAFRRLGCDAPIVLNHLLPGRRPLVLGFHLLPWLAAPPALPGDAVIYNLEQLPGLALAEHPQLKLLLRHEVWDYSARNLDWLRSQGGRGRLLPVGWVPELGRIAVQPAEEVDVLFYGTMSPRRQAILDALRARGLHVRYAYGVYGAERDALIGGAKLVLNLHNRGARIFELVRVSYLLANGRAVVAECDDATELPADLRDGLCAVPYDGLVDACAALVADPAARRELGRRALAAMRRRDAAGLLATLLKAEAAEDGAIADAALPVGGNAQLIDEISSGEDSTGVPHPALSRGRGGCRGLLRTPRRLPSPKSRAWRCRCTHPSPPGEAPVPARQERRG